MQDNHTEVVQVLAPGESRRLNYGANTPVVKLVIVPIRNQVCTCVDQWVRDKKIHCVQFESIAIRVGTALLPWQVLVFISKLVTFTSTRPRMVLQYPPRWIWHNSWSGDKERVASFSSTADDFRRMKFWWTCLSQPKLVPVIHDQIVYS